MADRLLTLALQAADFSTSAEGHSAMAAEPLDYLITFLGAIIVLVVITSALNYFLRPREGDSQHIKRRILREEG